MFIESVLEDDVNRFLEFYITKDSFYNDKEVLEYLKEIKKFKRLSIEEEKVLLKKISKGDEDAFHDFCHSNLLLALNIAQKYSNRCSSITNMELIQEANMGLMDAIKEYNLSLGYKFSSFASHVIENRILNYLKSYGKTISIANPSFSDLRKIKQIEEELMKKYKRYVIIEEIFEEFVNYKYGLDIKFNFYQEKKAFERFLKLYRLRGEVVSIDTLDQDKLFGFYDIEDILTQNQESSALKEAIRNSNLSEVELKIINERYIIQPLKTLQEIANSLNVSKERVRQIEKRGLLKIGNYLRKFNSDLVKDRKYF